MMRLIRTTRLNVAAGMAVAVLATGGLGACAHESRPASALRSTAAPGPQTPPSSTQKGFLTKAGDATWNVVSAPVRILTPSTQPKPTTQPATYEAPEVIFLGPLPEQGN